MAVLRGEDARMALARMQRRSRRAGSGAPASSGAHQPLIPSQAPEGMRRLSALRRTADRVLVG